MVKAQQSTKTQSTTLLIETVSSVDVNESTPELEKIRTSI